MKDIERKAAMYDELVKAVDHMAKSEAYRRFGEEPDEAYEGDWYRVCLEDIKEYLMDCENSHLAKWWEKFMAYEFQVPVRLSIPEAQITLKKLTPAEITAHIFKISSPLESQLQPQTEAAK